MTKLPTTYESLKLQLYNEQNIMLIITNVRESVNRSVVFSSLLPHGL